MFALLTTLALASDPLMHQHWSSTHTPWGLVKTLNQQHGEILDTDLIQELHGHDVPPLLTAVVVHNFLENFTLNEPKYSDSVQKAALLISLWERGHSHPRGTTAPQPSQFPRCLRAA